MTPSGILRVRREGLSHLEQGEGLLDEVFHRAVHFEVDGDLAQHGVQHHQVVCHAQPLRKPAVHLLRFTSAHSIPHATICDTAEVPSLAPSERSGHKC